MTPSRASHGGEILAGGAETLADSLAEGRWGGTHLEDEFLGFKGFTAAAGLLGVGIGDAKAGAGEAVLVIDDGAGEGRRGRGPRRRA